MSGNELWVKLCPADLAFSLGPATLPFKGQSLFDLDTEFLGLVNLSFFSSSSCKQIRGESTATVSVQALGLMQAPFYTLHAKLLGRQALVFKFFQCMYIWK